MKGKRSPLFRSRATRECDLRRDGYSLPPLLRISSYAEMRPLFREYSCGTTTRALSFEGIYVGGGVVSMLLQLASLARTFTSNCWWIPCTMLGERRYAYPLYTLHSMLHRAWLVHNWWFAFRDFIAANSAMHDRFRWYPAYLQTRPCEFSRNTQNTVCISVESSQLCGGETVNDGAKLVCVECILKCRWLLEVSVTFSILHQAWCIFHCLENVDDRECASIEPRGTWVFISLHEILNEHIGSHEQSFSCILNNPRILWARRAVDPLLSCIRSHWISQNAIIRTLHSPHFSRDYQYRSIIISG